MCPKNASPNKIIKRWIMRILFLFGRGNRKGEGGLPLNQKIGLVKGYPVPDDREGEGRVRIWESVQR